MLIVLVSLCIAATKEILQEVTQPLGSERTSSLPATVGDTGCCRGDQSPTVPISAAIPSPSLAVPVEATLPTQNGHADPETTAVSLAELRPPPQADQAGCQPAPALPAEEILTSKIDRPQPVGAQATPSKEETSLPESAQTPSKNEQPSSGTGPSSPRTKQGTLGVLGWCPKLSKLIKGQLKMPCVMSQLFIFLVGELDRQAHHH